MRKAQHYAFNVQQDTIIQHYVRDLPFIQPIFEESGYLKHPLISRRDLCHVFTYYYRFPLIPFIIDLFFRIVEDNTSRENRDRCIQYKLLIPRDKLKRSQSHG